MKYELTKIARHDGEKDVLLGIVSHRYEPLQNQEAFQFFDPIVGEGAAILETAGALGDGERVWVLAKLPGAIRVIGDDIVRKYLLISNAHNGREAVTIKFTPIRVVCQNTLVMALRDGNKSLKVRHTRNMAERLRLAPNLLGIFRDCFENAQQCFQWLARIDVDAQRLYQYLEAVLPLSVQDRKAGRTPKSWARITELFERGDHEPPETRGTLWAAYNAVTRFEDYRQTTEASKDRRLNRVWFGSGADLKARALERAKQLGQNWLN